MQTAQIIITCPNCNSQNIKKNGIKKNQKQNYFCNACKRQFVFDFFMTYNGSKSGINNKVLLMLARGVGIRDIAVIEKISVNKVLKILINSNYEIKPKEKHYKRIEIDEFWTYVQNKKNKFWLIYAYSRNTGEILAYVWGKRDLQTAKQLKDKISNLSITYEYISIDRWESFLTAFKDDKKLVGKYHTLGIEGNNCRIRHRIKRAVRKTCAFSKSEKHHKKAFDLVFYYINNNTV